MGCSLLERVLFFNKFYVVGLSSLVDVVRASMLLERVGFLRLHELEVMGRRIYAAFVAEGGEAEFS